MKVIVWRNKVTKDKNAILKDIQKYQPINSLLEVSTQSWNAIFHGFGESGDYCIKIFNEKTTGIRRTYKDLSYVADTMHLLHNKGFECILPPVKSKGKYIRRCGGYWVIVFPWESCFTKFNLIENQAQKISVTKKAAGLLSQMHSLTSKNARGLISPITREIPQAYKPSIWAAESGTLWTVAVKNLRKRMASNEALEKLHIARKIGEKMLEEDSWFFTDTPEKEVVVHGDFRPENILMGPNNFYLVFDFDLVHMDYPEIDVAYSALNFAGPRWLIGLRNWEICSAFITAYKQSSSRIKVSSHRLDLALRWTLIKSLSLSFDEKQVLGRLNLYYDMLKNLSLLRNKNI